MGHRGAWRAGGGDDSLAHIDVVAPGRQHRAPRE